MEAGYIQVYNLYGGIFEWVNEGHPVFNDQGETDKIHAYNKLWGMWLIPRLKHGRMSSVILSANKAIFVRQLGKRSAAAVVLLHTTNFNCLYLDRADIQNQ